METDHKKEFSGREIADLVGITYRQLDYWARTDLIRPSVRDASGSGSRRRYSEDDLRMLCFVKQMLDAGVNLDRVREAIENVREHGVQEGTLVVLYENTVMIVQNVADLATAPITAPFSVFPITMPNLSYGTCMSNHGYFHRFPHAESGSCRNWQPEKKCHVH